MGVRAGAKPCGARRAERLGRAQARTPIERRTALDGLLRPQPLFFLFSSVRRNRYDSLPVSMM